MFSSKMKLHDKTAFILDMEGEDEANERQTGVDENASYIKTAPEKQLKGAMGNVK